MHDLLALASPTRDPRGHLLDGGNTGWTAPAFQSHQIEVGPGNAHQILHEQKLNFCCTKLLIFPDLLVTAA